MCLRSAKLAKFGKPIHIWSTVRCVCVIKRDVFQNGFEIAPSNSLP